MTSKIASKTLNDYETNFDEHHSRLIIGDTHKNIDLLDHFHKIGSFPLWGSGVDLVKESKSNSLLPRLIEHLKFPVYFMFGEKNRNRFSSEKLIKQAKLPIVYIPHAGHYMHVENPPSFWKIITNKIELIDNL